MSRCVALVHSRRLEPSWVPCTREALPRGRFCARHREQIEGALLGFYLVTEAPYAEEEQREDAVLARRVLQRKRTIRRKRRAARLAGAKGKTKSTQAQTALPREETRAAG
jgi:hypothetical protein